MTAYDAVAAVVLDRIWGWARIKNVWRLKEGKV